MFGLACIVSQGYIYSFFEIGSKGPLTNEVDLKTELQREELSAGVSRFAIIVARWHHELTSALKDGAVRALSQSGAAASSIETYYVPGAFELPIVSKRAASSGDFDAVIAIGVVIRGDTPHFDYVAGQAAEGIMRVGLDTGVPVMFGVITVENMQQAIDRCGDGDDNKGFEAAISAIETVEALRNVDKRKGFKEDPINVV